MWKWKKWSFISGYAAEIHFGKPPYIFPIYLSIEKHNQCQKCLTASSENISTELVFKENRSTEQAYMQVQKPTTYVIISEYIGRCQTTHIYTRTRDGALQEEVKSGGFWFYSEGVFGQATGKPDPLKLASVTSVNICRQRPSLVI